MCATLRWLVPAALCLACSCEDHRLPDYSAFDAFVEQTRQAYHVPGAMVGIVRDTGTMFLKGYGVRSIGGAAAVDAQTKFQLASCTKFLAAASIGTLVDARAFTWEQPIKQLHPALALSDAAVTAKVSFADLLSHRAGFPAYQGDLLARLGYDTEELIRRARYVELSGYKQQGQYSNMAFFLAGELAAQLSSIKGADWITLVAKSVFEPLGMTRSSARPEDISTDANWADGHKLVNHQPVHMDLEADALYAAGSAVSTGEDLTHWLQMLLAGGKYRGKTILQPGTVEQLGTVWMRSGSDRSGPLLEPNGGYGLGTEVYYFLGNHVVTKNGALNGVRSMMALIPSLKIGIFVLANLNLTQFTEAVTARFLEDQLGTSTLDLQDYYQQEQKKWHAFEVPPTYPTSPAPLPVDVAKLEGAYWSALYGDVRLALDHGVLTIRTTSSPTSYSGTLSHWDGMTFLLEWPDPDDMRGLVEFHRDAATSQITDFTGFMSPSATFAAVNYQTFIRK